MHAEFDAFCRGRGAPPLPDLEFIHESPWLNLYLYPGEADYCFDADDVDGAHALLAVAR